MGPAEPPGDYSVGQVADLLSVQQAFLRRLEQFELVRPERSAGRQRRYGDEDVAQLRTVIDLVGDGVNLTGIARLLALQAEVDALRAELRQLQDRLA